MDGWTDGRRRLQYPHRFFFLKKRGDKKRIKQDKDSTVHVNRTLIPNTYSELKEACQKIFDTQHILRIGSM